MSTFESLVASCAPRRARCALAGLACVLGSITPTSRCPHVAQVTVPAPGPRSRTGTSLLCSSALRSYSCSGVFSIPRAPPGMPWGAGWSSLALHLLSITWCRRSKPPSPSRLRHLLHIRTSDGSDILHAFLLYTCLEQTPPRAPRPPHRSAWLCTLQTSAQAKDTHAVSGGTEGKGVFPKV